MLDNLYDKIGEKIKILAKLSFIVEGLGSVVAGFAIINISSKLIPYGILIMICGPIVAWVSSWILYAFGELVDDVHAIRSKGSTSSPTITPRHSSGGYICPDCRMSMDAMIPCERCGYVPPAAMEEKKKADTKRTR